MNPKFGRFPFGLILPIGLAISFFVLILFYNYSLFAASVTVLVSGGLFGIGLFILSRRH